MRALRDGGGLTRTPLGRQVPTILRAVRPRPLERRLATRDRVLLQTLHGVGQPLDLLRREVRSRGSGLGKFVTIQAAKFPAARRVAIAVLRNNT